MKEQMKTTWAGALLAVLLCVLFALGSFVPLKAFAVSYDKVASASDMTTVEEVGVEGMEPIAPKDVEPGTYDVTVESSSSMFKITKAVLTVADNAMTADLTLKSNSYPYLFAGTAKEAGKLNDVSKYIAPKEEDGAFTFTVPVANLDEGFPVAAFSKNKEQWYDRILLVRADSLPDGAVKVELPDYKALEQKAIEERIAEKKDTSSEIVPADVDLHNGSYQINVTLTGGSGKASIASPTTLTAVEGKAYATILWSSPNYDYMIIDGQRIEPQNAEGENSTFVIPITKFNEPMTVIADTTAMSKPHEIEYQLTFDEDSIQRYSSKLIVYMGLALIVVLLGAYGVYRFWTKD